ncbi:MAG: glutamine synthetase beta-grasp domain-containing protein [Gemmatimonadetes bacterium]|nr:glutamine synthetase beta-grasp domain-containing protein [Gemmatimonadota bacterium]
MTRLTEASPAARDAARALRRDLSAPPAAWSAADLAAFVRNHDIRVVALMHVGGDGWLKTLDFVPRDDAHLLDILAGGERADGSSLFGDLGIPVGASDIVLRPRLSTAFIDPFAAEPTLALLCSHYDRQGAPLPESPDTMVRAAYARLRRDVGHDLHALGEIEFFLGHVRAESEAYGANERGYHAAAPFVFGEGLRRSAVVMLAEMGVPVKYGHAEVGFVEADAADSRAWEQHEIELALLPLPEAADAVVLAQWVLRNLALRHGMLCSFAPMARKGHAGSGMHFHFASLAEGSYQPHSADDGGLTPGAQALIGGLVRHGGALMAFGNRSRDSFVRLSQGKEAPSVVTWGRYNRKALVRIPIVPTDAHGRATTPETIEFRLPDGSAHPHLLLAGVAQAMADATASKELAALLARTAVSAQGASSTEHRVPLTFAEIADAMRASRTAFEAGGVFSAAMLNRVIATLRA